MQKIINAYQKTITEHLVRAGKGIGQTKLGLLKRAKLLMVSVFYFFSWKNIFNL